MVKLLAQLGETGFVAVLGRSEFPGSAGREHVERRVKEMARRKRQPVAQPLLLTIPDVAIQLGVCRNTVYNLIYHSGLPSVLLGGVRRVHPASLQEWLKQCEQRSA